MSNNSKAIKSGIWYTLSNFLIRGIGLITTPIFTRLLTKAEFGLYNNYTSWLSIVSIFITLNLESTLISARYDYEDRFDNYIFSVLALSTLSTCVWFIVFNVFISFFSGFFEMDRFQINAMLTYLLFFPAVNLFQTRERYYFGYKKTVITSLILSLGTAVLSVFLVLSLDNRLMARIIGSIIPTVLLGLLFFFYFFKKGKTIRIEYWKYALPICLPYIPHLLSLNILNSMDRVMITKWCTPEDTAMYSLAYTCGSLVTLLLVSVNSAFAPWLGEKLHAEKYEEIRSFSRVYIICFFALAVGIMLISPEILLVLGGTDYLEAKYVMTPIAMGCVCQFLYSMFVNVEQFKKKTLGMAMASITAALINLLLNFIFIPRIGYLAAAYTTLIGYICLLAIHMYLVFKLGYNEVYDYKLVAITVCAGCIVTAFITYLYSFSILRYILVAIYAVVLISIIYLNKGTIIKIIKK